MEKSLTKGKTLCQKIEMSPKYRKTIKSDNQPRKNISCLHINIINKAMKSMHD